MKRVTQGGDINFNVAYVRGLGENYAFRFYTTDSCRYIVRVDGDAVDGVIRLEWNDLKTLGDGVLNYFAENLEPDEEYSDTTFNRTFGGTTQWYVVTSCGGSGSSEEISELSDRLDAEIERSTDKDEELEDAIGNTYTKAEVDQKIAEAEMGGDLPESIVVDPNYVHTDNNFTTNYKNKLDGIATGAEVNVQADWNVTDTSSDAYIQHKPTIPQSTSELTNDSNFVVDANYVHTDNNFTTTEKNKLANAIVGVNTHNGQSLPVTNGVVTLPESGGTGTSGDVSVTTNQDGTFVIHVGSNDYTVNLNHSHPNMCKLEIIDEEPSEPALDTIYAQVDDASAPSLIQALWIAGVQFVGGGAAPSEPFIALPSGTTINLGENNGSGVSKQVKIQGRNLTGDLTVTVGTGLTVSYDQTTNASSVTIPITQALVGAMVTISYSGSGALTDGSLVITGGGAAPKTMTVVVTEQVVQLAAVKFTKQQYVQTDICPGPNTKLEFDIQFSNAADGGSDVGIFGCPSDTSYSPSRVFNANTASYAQMQGSTYDIYLWVEEPWLNNSSPSYALRMAKAAFLTRSTLVIDLPNQNASFSGATTTLPQKTTTMPLPMKFGSNSSGTAAFRIADITVYSIKHYESGVLAHEYLPQERAGVAGLYDTVTQTFISSANEYELVAIQNS